MYELSHSSYDIGVVWDGYEVFITLMIIDAIWLYLVIIPICLEGLLVYVYKISMELVLSTLHSSTQKHILHLMRLEPSAPPQWPGLTSQPFSDAQGMFLGPCSPSVASKQVSVRKIPSAEATAFVTVRAVCLVLDRQMGNMVHKQRTGILRFKTSQILSPPITPPSV